MTIPLGTVAIEPNRWGTVDPSRHATVVLDDWLEAIRDAGFDGIELWERHLSDAVATNAMAPVVVFNTYVSFEADDPVDRSAVAVAVGRTPARTVQLNVGDDIEQEGRYGERLAAFVDQLVPGVAVLCECHSGTIADEPRTAARILAAAGPVDRVQAIVHTHETDDELRKRFDAYGERITHVHVNLLDGALTTPRLADVADRLATKIGLLRDLGFEGSWTIEFVHGLFTAHDRPDELIDQAAADLVVLREVVER